MKQETIAQFLTRNLKVTSKSGFEWQATCPFHQDSTPSFSFNIKKGLFICYACGEKGNTKKLIEFLNGGSVVEEGRSTEEIFESVSEKIDEAKNSLFATSRPSVGIKIPARYLNGILLHPYWTNNRKLNDETVEKYQLGYDDIANQAIIPLNDKHGRTLGLIRRSFEPDRPKYLYPKGLKISECLFGIDIVHKESVNKTSHNVLVITEGSVDAMVLNQCGYDAVAVLGARISPRQVELIKELGKTRIVVATDNDRAGRLADLQIVHELKRSRLGSFIFSVDWSELQNPISKGLVAKDFAEIIQNAEYSQFTYKNYISSLILNATKR